ncbi:hypothetical protein [Microbacterium sp. CIAB417]|uniref:hypothetical protein n=1 Tax=Microbacterium sp. CIAB417 TaxID=2860287 RepID=UPI001FAD5FBA|nr:hypothetical protein [Microbacterium sp. CIAB417]
MSMKKLIRDIMDAVDDTGHEFKKGFSGAFRKRGGKHRADADAIRGLDRRNAGQVPKHRADGKPASHAKKYDMLEDVTRGREYQLSGKTPRHRDPDYDLARDFGRSVGQEIRAVPGDVLDEVKGIPKNVPGQVVEELYEDAIGQDNPDKYGATAQGDASFLAPASEAAVLRGLSTAEIAARFGVDPASLQRADIQVKEIPGSRFVSVEIDVPGA